MILGHNFRIEIYKTNKGKKNVRNNKKEREKKKRLGN